MCIQSVQYNRVCADGASLSRRPLYAAQVQMMRNGHIREQQTSQVSATNRSQTVQPALQIPTGTQINKITRFQEIQILANTGYNRRYTYDEPPPPKSA